MAHLGAELIAAFQQNPEKPALICADTGALSRGEVMDAMAWLTAQIAEAGVPKLSRIAIIAPKSRHAVISFLACLQGYVAAPLNPGYTRDEFLFYLKDLNPSLVILGEQVSPDALSAVEDQALPKVMLDDHTPMPSSEGICEVEHFKPSAPALILHSSGTTGRPKMIELSQANLEASARNIAHSLHLTADDRCLSVMPLFHIHGLMANVCATLLSGGAVVVKDQFTPADFVHNLALHRPTWYSAVPTIHIALINHIDATNAPVEHHLRFVRSSSAALPTAIITRLERCFDVPVIEAYGMTEASHQIATNPLPPGTRRPGTVGLAAGTRIEVHDDAGQPVKAGEVGNVVIQGDGVTAGYVENPMANRDAFKGAFFWTGDLGRLGEDGFLTLTGRRKEIVNRGGQKISSVEIDDALLAIEGVADAVAFGRVHPSLGEDLVAAVVLQPDAAIDGQDIRARLFETLIDYKVPSQIAVVDSIPVGATGKRQRLNMWKALSAAFETPSRAPTNAVEHIVCEFTAEVLNVHVVGPDDNFFNLGGNSILGLQLAATLGDLMGCHVPSTALFRYPTPAVLSDYIQGLLSPQDLARLEDAVAKLADIDTPVS